MFQKIKSSPSIVVFFQEEQQQPAASSTPAGDDDDALLKTLEATDKVLAEMEIPFVKSFDHGIAEEYGIGQVPSIVVFQVCGCCKQFAIKRALTPKRARCSRCKITKFYLEL